MHRCIELLAGATVVGATGVFCTSTMYCMTTTTATGITVHLHQRYIYRYIYVHIIYIYSSSMCTGSPVPYYSTVVVVRILVTYF
jgi:hypothetical protein